MLCHLKFPCGFLFIFVVLVFYVVNVVYERMLLGLCVIIVVHDGLHSVNGGVMSAFCTGNC